MTHTFVAETETFWIAHSEDALEHGVLAAQETIQTGQPYLETYDDPRQWNTRLVFLRKDYPSALAEWLETLRLRDPLAHLADYRWQRETGGVTCGNGAMLHTTRESQSQMTSTIVSMQEKLIPSPVPWKAANGWYVMDLYQMKAAAAQVAAHVARCFKAEEIVLHQLQEDETLDVVDAFETAYADLKSQEPVNINTASAENMAARLPGMGEVKAAAVVAARPWGSVTDLPEVSGISEEMVEAWQEYPGLRV